MVEGAGTGARIRIFTHFLDDRFEVSAFERRGAGLSARGPNVREHFRVGESGGLSFKDLSGRSVHDISQINVTIQ